MPSFPSKAPCVRKCWGQHRSPQHICLPCRKHPPAPSALCELPDSGSPASRQAIPAYHTTQNPPDQNTNPPEPSPDENFSPTVLPLWRPNPPPARTCGRYRPLSALQSLHSPLPEKLLFFSFLHPLFHHPGDTLSYCTDVISNLVYTGMGNISIHSLGILWKYDILTTFLTGNGPTAAKTFQKEKR